MNDDGIGWKKPALAAAALAGWVLWLCGAASRLPAEEAVDLRLENFTVMPSTGPVIHAWVRNRTQTPLDLTLLAQWPQGWKVQPPAALSLAPGATGKAAFAVEQAADALVNRYPVALQAQAGGKSWRSAQEVLVATAPYLKPVIDGQLEDWKDAVPIGFSTQGRSTSVLTCWNRKLFCLAVRVEEERLGASLDGQPGDAIQFALQPLAAASPEQSPERSSRCEFLVTTTGQEAGRGFLLLRPGDDCSLAAAPRPLAGLECPDLQTAVSHSEGATVYEIAVPLNLLPGLRATPGRSFGFSLLVHDPGGTGLRDLGSVMRLWPDRRDAAAWCRWEGASFGDPPPFDNQIEFGFSSSIH